MNTTTASTETIYLSKKGFKELKKAIAQLERDRHQTIMMLHEQDKTEKHDERYARIEKYMQLDTIESELQEKQEILRTAKLMKTGSFNSVDIGSEVELVDQKGIHHVYTIVSSIEANPSDGRISSKSPLGRTLLGKKIKDTIEWGMGKNNFKLTRIS